MKPIKVKKKDKSCPNCKHYRQNHCGLWPKERIPIKTLHSGCRKYKKNKYLYF